MDGIIFLRFDTVCFELDQFSKLMAFSKNSVSNSPLDIGIQRDLFE
jgi:hypothetical protein